LGAGTGAAATFGAAVAFGAALAAGFGALVLAAVGSAVLADHRGGQPARFGQIRLTLESLDLKSRADRLSLGGGPDDGMTIEGAPAGLASVRPLTAPGQPADDKAILDWLVAD
jgi:hypothetical protein